MVIADLLRNVGMWAAQHSSWGSRQQVAIEPTLGVVEADRERTGFGFSEFLIDVPQKLFQALFCPIGTESHCVTDPG